MRLAYSTSNSVDKPKQASQGLQLQRKSDLDRTIQRVVGQAVHQGIGELEEVIAAVVQRTGRAGESQALPSIVGALTEAGNFGALLYQLLGNEAALVAIQQRSYYHHNGFRKLVLLQNASFKLRLHLWEARQEHHHENIHDHRWNFASRLLAGRFQTVIWEEDADGPETRLDCTYTPAQDGNTYGVRENGQVRLRQQATHWLQAGDLYYMPASTLHQVTDPGQGHTRSLMLTAPPVLAGCKLYAEHSIPEKDKDNVPFTLDAIRAELGALLLTCEHSYALAA
jgi:hypothetical protein